MSTQPLDYSAILADLENKKVAIEGLIASLRLAMASGTLRQTGDVQSDIGTSNVVPSITGGEVPDGAFLGKSIPEAAQLLLEIVKKKQTTREIADALQRGGIESTSGNFVGIVHAVLNRARRSANSPLVKLGSHWGLKGWYPKGILSAAAPTGKKAKKKTSRSATKATAMKPSPKASAEPPKPPEKNIPQPVTASEGAVERIASLLRSKPGVEFGAEEIAGQIGLKKQVAVMLLGTLARKGRAEKTGSGKFRLPIPEPVAVSIAI